MKIRNRLLLVAVILGVGLGVVGGYKVTDQIYVGARFQYNLGSSQSIGGYSLDYHTMQLGVEGGYDVSVADKLTIRPEVGLGLAISSVSVPNLFTSGTTSQSATDIYISLGAALLYDVTPDIFIGAHVDLPIVLASGTSMGLHFLATGGMRF